MKEIFILMTVTSVGSSQCPKGLRPLAASWDSPRVFMTLGGSHLCSLLFLPLTLEPFRSTYYWLSLPPLVLGLFPFLCVTELVLINIKSKRRTLEKHCIGPDDAYRCMYTGGSKGAHLPAVRANTEVYARQGKAPYTNRNSADSQSRSLAGPPGEVLPFWPG